MYFHILADNTKSLVYWNKHIIVSTLIVIAHRRMQTDNAFQNVHNHQANIWKKYLVHVGIT